MKSIIFDLDSTLLQMDQDLFLKLYFKGIQDKFSPLTSDINGFMKAFGIAAYNIIKNDGKVTNKEYFFNMINSSIDIANLEDIFMSYYLNEFKEISRIVDKTKYPKLIIEELKKKGYKLYLATNPLFPDLCTYERISWAGLSKDDFEYISTYENSSYCKPRLEYYLDFANKNNIDLANSIMIGNDVDDDFMYLPEYVEKILVTNHLINKNNKDLTEYHCMSIEELYEYTKKNL